MTDPDLLSEIKARRVARADWWQPKDPAHPYSGGFCRYCGKDQAGADWDTGDLHEDGCPAASDPDPDIDWLVGKVERHLGQLARLEWAGRDGLWPCCPACQGHQRDGHVGIGPERTPCWLAAELGR
jgi:hypothetical protein